MKLTVLAGAKAGTAVPIKKNSFTIGRSKECTLRAGSEAISRKHCELKVTDDGVTVQDLGSRNGTYVNDEKIDGVQSLSNGDRLRIGPLEFRYDAGGELKKAKAPKVTSAAEAVERSKSSGSPDDQNFEASISDWLLSPPDASTASPDVAETMTMRTDETQQVVDSGAEASEAAAEETDPEETAEDDDLEDSGKGKKGKKKPGKLPFRPAEPQAKDSREAAANILREMARRR